MGGGAGVSTRLMNAIAPATFPPGSNVIRMKQKLQANMKFMRHPKVLSNVRMKGSLRWGYENQFCTLSRFFNVIKSPHPCTHVCIEREGERKEYEKMIL